MSVMSPAVETTVISSVMEEVRKGFQHSGLDEATLLKLEKLWSEKLKILQEVEIVEEAEVGSREESLGAESGPAHTRQEAEEVILPQLDGHAESSEEEGDDKESEEDDDSDTSDLDTDEEEELNDVGEDMGQPCSDDDLSDDDGDGDIFDTENVIVCQYDKISRSRNRWKFTLKNGIMKLNGQDYVFEKALGEVDW